MYCNTVDIVVRASVNMQTGRWGAFVHQSTSAMYPMITLQMIGFKKFLCARSLGYFRFYVILGFFIIISGSLIGIFLPLWEARHLFFKVNATEL